MVSMISRTGRQLQRYNQGCRQVVGCIPYRYKFGINGDKELEVLLISSQKGQKMLFPKGGWEIDESIKEAAARETFEEAGVQGDVEFELGSWMFQSKRYGTLYEGFMFSLLVKEQLDFWPERNVRTRRWMTVEEARDVCQYGWMKEALEELVSLDLTSSKQPERGVTHCSLS
ncbi:hypothetical protein AQUCO_01400703v1 [Aquilegia coerulea]|uniref:Nudix hydrolase domain-containing protein n=1 Tax=Aquilegia coerulea TaxID=218851 RepID=A0A2G5DYG1_AQUCA|nr:hypothetical protein AQUCO_01400703v1 [Aquilegia coerulea]